MSFLKKEWLFVASLICVIFLATFKLTESPGIWMDEGIITQTSRAVVEHGHYGLQVAPNELISAGFVTTSYPVTLPIALSFKLFGIGLLQARIVMAIYIIALFLAMFALARKLFAGRVLACTILLFVTFAPIYGHGKNVLGEIPGLFFLVLGLFFLYKIEKGARFSFYFFLSGIFFGLNMVTKPVFLVLGPALLLAFIILWRKGERKNLLWGILGLAIPFLVWLPIQFHGDTISNILSIYANPHSTELGSSIKDNFLRFFKEAQPFYFFITLVIWLASIVYRKIKKIEITLVEWVAVIFSIFITIAYLRTIGYYRYFFPAQFFSIFFLAQAFFTLAPKKIPREVVVILLWLLILFQAYQLCFNSWVADFYTSHRTEEVKHLMGLLPHDAHVYVYQAPELITFLPSSNFSQYLEVTKTITIGKDSVEYIAAGKAPYVLSQEDVIMNNPHLFIKYKIIGQADKYIVMSKN